MTSGLLLKGAALVVFLGVLGGATYGVQTFLGDDGVAALAMQVDSPRPTLNATAGHALTFPVIVHNRGEVAQRALVRATGDGIESSTALAIVPAKANVTQFLTLTVPAGAAAGELPITVAILDADGAVLRTRDAALKVRVLEPGVGFQEGDVAQVRYTGRLASTGKVFDTNDPFVNVLTIPATDTFQAHGSQPLPVEFDRPGVIEGFFEGLAGMQPGESRTISFPPEKAYGPALTPREVERVERLERQYALEIATDAVGRSVFDDYVSESGQGNGSEFEPGEVFRFEQGPNRWPYEVVSISDETVEYRLAVSPGENYTLYPFWEGASRVVAVNGTHASFVTDPTTAVDQPFTMRSYWPEMSTILEITDTEIVVRHSPPVGFKFSQAAGQGQPAQEAVVQDVTDELIIVGVKSDNPLAGEALTFDVEILAITR